MVAWILPQSSGFPAPGICASIVERTDQKLRKESVLGEGRSVLKSFPPVGILEGDRETSVFLEHLLMKNNY